MTTSNNANTNTVRISAKKPAFTFDHVNKKIVGKDVDFQKAGIPGSDLEKELIARMEARPSYSFTVIPTEKNSTKQSYRGLNKELMREYISIQEEAAKADLNARLDKMIAEKIAFPTIRSWFLDEFKGFSVSKAHREIQKHKLNSTKARVRLIKATPKEQPKVVNF